MNFTCPTASATFGVAGLLNLSLSSWCLVVSYCDQKCFFKEHRKLVFWAPGHPLMRWAFRSKISQHSETPFLPLWNRGKWAVIGMGRMGSRETTVLCSFQRVWRSWSASEAVEDRRRWLRRKGMISGAKSWRRGRGMDIHTSFHSLYQQGRQRKRGRVWSPVNERVPFLLLPFLLGVWGKGKLEGMEGRGGRSQEPGETREGCPGSGSLNIAEKGSRIAKALRCHLRTGVIHSKRY